MKKFISILFYLVIAVLGTSLLVGWFCNSNLNLPYQTFLVQSGSMEPSIMTGDIILIKKTQQVAKNDVITFVDNQDRVVTHRIIDLLDQNGQTVYKTKGDANQSADVDSVETDQIKGKVTFTIPKLGYLVRFSKSKLGILLLVLAPAIIIIYEELQTLFQEVNS